MKNPGPPQYTLPETVVKTPHPPTQDTNGARATRRRLWSGHRRVKPSFGRAEPYTPALPSPLAAIIARNESDSRSDYRLRTKLNVKVLDFVQLGGPILTIDRTIFEMWLGDL